MKKLILLLSTALFYYHQISAQTNWQALSTNVTDDIGSIQIFGNDTLFMFGYSGNVLTTFDGGNTITKKHVNAASVISAGYFRTLDTGFVGSGSGNILRTTNGGTSWTSRGGCTCMITSICFSNQRNGIFTGLGGLYRTTDGGSTWNLGPSATPAFNDLISLNDSTFVGAYHFSFYKSTDYGQTFHHDTIHRSSNSPFSTISFLDKQTGYMSTADGYIYRTSDAGAHWTLISASGFFNVRSILFTDVFHGYMITNYNIYTTFNGGSSWFFEYSSNKLLNKLAADANHVFVAGDSGLVLRKSIILPVSQLPVMNHSLELIPNPAGNTVMIKPDAEIEPGTVVEVLNTLGQTVYTQEYKTEADKVLSIASFNPGLYICRLMYKGEQTGYSRFLKE